ncbi:MAG: SIS domain-containing protein [Holophagales bacterium]|nr:SIS domain-containing protein [Holophagales bacterium]MYG32307.1 SIS domain-containing protein [Holophagales bacterium]MYI78524.1 SIS domain-containing protein [Holophagales bacterium]
MCGIVGILMRPHPGPAIDSRELLEGLATAGRAAEAAVSDCGHAEAQALAQSLTAAASGLAAWDRRLRARPSVRALVRDEALRTAIADALRPCSAAVNRLGARLDDGAGRFGDVGLEAVNRAAAALADAEWAIRRDRLRTAAEAGALAPAGVSDAGLDVLIAVQQAFSSLDRLEIRGRDSAGLFLLLSGHGLGPDDPAIGSALDGRAGDPLFGHRAVQLAGGRIGLVYKCAEEIGELGDNVRFLRDAVASDPLLAAALGSPDVEAAVLGHTRWASVGRINEANAHPLNDAERPPQVIAAINGDIDNHADLKVLENLEFDSRITTDAKVMPVLMARRLAGGDTAFDAFRETVAAFEGSLALGALTWADPSRLYLATQGSGQGLYVGLADHAFVVASEPYGLVEETSIWLRLDGEAEPDRAGAGWGQIAVLDARRAGELEGIERYSAGGSPLPVAPEELDHAEITTRDIDRGEFQHFLLKEISEAPRSVRNTVRGKLREDATGRLRVSVGERTLPEAVARGLREGTVARIVVTGQGTAAVAGQSIAAAIEGRLRERGLSRPRVDAMPATELSGFHLAPDMRDTLVVAVSQSGTTTDTLRTVNLAQRRGARAIAIVNRRNSDLADRADGVLYTSDGRDVEMSVASTKAFYSQIAAGMLLAVAIADQVAGGPDERPAADRLLRELRNLPGAMERTLTLRSAIAAAAREYAPRLRDWSVVGNGLDRIAAEEIRIKLSELCYKAIACDATEDKKHIDLSSEPLILVCATGVQGSTAADTRKEIDVYRAHRATPIVIASEGAAFPSAAAVIEVPEVPPELSFVLATVVGHLFGYHAALAIDDLARPLRAIRTALDDVAGDGKARPVARLREVAGAEIDAVSEGLAGGRYDGNLHVGRAVRLAVALDGLGGAGDGGEERALAELRDALTPAIDDLTRHIDTIKHQAKTVTVGISRHDQTLGRMSLEAALRQAGSPEESISTEDRRTMSALDPFVDQVLGYVRYRLRAGGDGPPPGDDATIRVLRAGGLCRDLQSRTVRQPLLQGTKYAVAVEGRLMAARGRTDGRVFIVVPEVTGDEVSALVLIHVRFRERAEAPALRRLLSDYRERYEGLRDHVLRKAPEFDDRLLAELPVEDLLIDPVAQLAERWQSTPSGGAS